MNHPADKLKSADGVLIRDLIPPVWFFPEPHPEPVVKKSVQVTTAQMSDGSQHCYVSVDGQSVNASDLWQDQRVVYTEKAKRLYEQAIAAFQQAASIPIGGAS